MKLELVGLPDSDLKLICEMSLAAPRPLVPTHLRRQIIAELHKLAHPGVKASIALVQERFFWPNLPTDVRKFVETCLPCQRAKNHRHVHVDTGTPTQRCSSFPCPPTVLTTCT